VIQIYFLLETHPIVLIITRNFIFLVVACGKWMLTYFMIVLGKLPQSPSAV
jgi:hypothetical protein